jgi:LacI family transcriptional regulator
MRSSLTNNAVRSARTRRDTVGLRDIAKLASVDISTASRALNYDPRVNAARADQIRKLAEQIGYRPRPLRSKSARSVGMLVTADVGLHLNNFQERLAWLAQRALADRRLHVNLEAIPMPYVGQLPAVVQQNRVDGVLLGGHPAVEMVAEIRALGMPAVAINDSVERLGISCVRSNPEPAMRQAILHLAARGHLTFALLTTNFEYPTIRARHNSYEAALREIGIEPQPQWLVSDLAGEIAGGREGIQRLRQRGPLPTAILCENDWMALGAMQELQYQKLRVPQDISLVGHDDLWICQQLDPKLTSIHRAEDKLVSKAIDLLIEQIDSEGPVAPREVLVDGEMVWRQSAGPAPERLKEHCSIGEAL